MWSDRELLFSFRNFVGSEDRPVKEVTRERCHNASFEFRSWKIHNLLNKYELTKRKDSRGRLHFSLLQPEIRKHFIRGLMDADGSFYYQTKSKDLHSELTGFKPLLKDIKNVLVEDGIINETKNIVKNGSVFRIRLAKQDTIKLIDYLYDGKQELKYKLNRKYALATQYRERLNDIDTDGVSDSPQKYHRPISSFNVGKQGEHSERVQFKS